LRYGEAHVSRRGRGRVLHHLARRLPDSRNAVLLAGFQAEGTRTLRIHDEDVPVKAETIHLQQFSAHADRGELLRWLRGLPTPPRRIFLVHGEPAASRALGDLIREQLRWDVSLPSYGESVDLASRRV
jgi:metallo-beta-lactamase family protein